MNDVEAGVLMNQNWNRIAELTCLRSHSKKLSEKHTIEIRYRIMLQNAFSCSKTKDEEQEVFCKIEAMNAQGVPKRKAVVE